MITLKKIMTGQEDDYVAICLYNYDYFNQY